MALAEAREILERLIAFRTVSRDSNLALIDWVERFCAERGIACTRVPAGDGQPKAALYAWAGPEVAGGVVLSSHSDVVPVDGQDWSSDPFELVERDGRLYGRGTCDMKGFTALSLAALAEAARRSLARPLQVAISYDEELGLIGCEEMIDHMVGALPKADVVIVGEPSMMQVVTGHKGGIAFAVTVTGYEVHSSMQHVGVSAIHEAGRVLGWLNDTNARLAATPPAPLAAQFEPPFSTVHVGMISGGTAGNITAGECRFDLGVRVIPGESSRDWAERFRAACAEIEAGMKAVRPEAGIALREKFDCPPLVPEQAGAAEVMARRLTGDNARHVVSYGTEAGHFQARGYSVVVCGPGDIAQAHQADEFLSLAQFEAGWAFMEGVLRELS